MKRRILLLSALALLLVQPGMADAQRRPVPRHPPHPQAAVVVRGMVFIGGYFYDPVWGAYPWWPRTAYPYWYHPVYDSRADIRLRVEPDPAEQAAVYVDGFYAGLVDDFNGVFQSLPLTPGGHTLVLYLEGWRTERRNVYLSPGSSHSMRVTLERLPAGVWSEPPELAPAVPPPPSGSYRLPVTPPRTALTPPAPPAVALGFGTVDIFVRPANAVVLIDGQQWISSEEGHFVIQVPAGRHRVEVSRTGFRPFETEIHVGDGQTVPLNISLITTAP